MVSSSSAQQANANALLVSNPLILSSSAPTQLTPSNNFPSNFFSSFAAHNSIAQSTNQQQQQQQQQQHFLQLIQNQQRPFLYPQQMFIPPNQLLTTTKTTNGTNNPQTVFINPNLLSQQQQILLNKNLIDSQKGKPIIIPGQQTANLQTRSHLLSGLQQFKSPAQLLATQSPILNQAQFLTNPLQQSAIAWPPNSPIILRPQSTSDLFLQTTAANQPTTPIYVNHQNGNVQFNGQLLQPSSSANEQSTDKLKTPKSTKATKIAKESTKEASDKTDKKSKAFLSSPVKANSVVQLKREKSSVLRYRNAIGEKLKINQSAKQAEETADASAATKLSKKQMMHKSTQQMNDELLEKARLDAADSLKAKKLTTKKDKLEKKNVSIVKPRVLLNHNVSGYLIQESDKPFPINDRKVEVSVHESTIKGEDATAADGPKQKKQKKQKKSKSLNHSDNSNDQDAGLIVLSPTEFELIPSKDADEVMSDAKSTYLNKSIYEWSVDDAFDFVLNTTSNKEFANALKRKDFNGNSLALLTIPILRNFEFSFKLGPILLLIKKINELKERFSSKLDDTIDIYLPLNNSNIFKWSVDEVYQFIRNLTSKESYADEFKKQEIDGHSLTLLSQDNIIKDLNIALGQALVIIDKINKLTEKVKK